MMDHISTPAPAAEAVESGDRPDGFEPFIEQMGVLCEADQMPRIAGRLLGLFLVEEQPLSLREIADRLKVSRASVSTNTRMLARVGLIERIGKPGDRQDYYKIADHPYQQMLSGMVQRMTGIGAFLADAAARFPDDRDVAKERLRQLSSFYGAAADAVSAMIGRFERRD